MSDSIKSQLQVDSDGKSIFSIRALARLGDKDHSRLVRDLKLSGASEPSKLAEHLMQQGFDATSLETWENAGIPDLAVPHILTYWTFKTEPRYRSEQAGIMLGAFASIGIRLWAQQLVGFKGTEDVLNLHQILLNQMANKTKIWDNIGKMLSEN